jgi:hypothetical protein
MLRQENLIDAYDGHTKGQYPEWPAQISDRNKHRKYSHPAIVAQFGDTAECYEFSVVFSWKNETR